MLHWQQSTHDAFDLYYHASRGTLKCRAAIVAVGMYSLLVIFLFVGSWLQSPLPMIMVRNDAAPVLFFSQGHGQGRGYAGNKKGATGSLARRRRAVAATSKKLQHKPVIAKTTKKTKLLKKEKQNAKEVVQKKVPNSAPKKIEHNKINKQIEKEQLQELSQPVKETKPIASKSEPVKKPVEQPIQEREEEKEDDVQIEQEAEEVVQQDEELEEVLVGQGSDALSDPAYKAHMALSRSISRVWRPPTVRIAQQVKLLVTLDDHGKAVATDFDQKSEVLAYDLAARAAVLRAEFPREFWQKTIAIVFGN